MAASQDEIGFLSGDVSPTQLNENAKARAAGAAIGLGVIGATEAIPAVYGAAETFLMRRIQSSVLNAFAENNALIDNFLSDKEAAQGASWARANFGKAVERAIGQKIESNPIYSRMFEVLGRVRDAQGRFMKAPDFASRWTRNIYDSTVEGSKWGAEHLQRGYEGVLHILGYAMP